jgi:hypothetical protein
MSDGLELLRANHRRNGAMRLRTRVQQLQVFVGALDERKISLGHCEKHVGFGELVDGGRGHDELGELRDDALGGKAVGDESLALALQQSKRATVGIAEQHKETLNAVVGHNAGNLDDVGGSERGATQRVSRLEKSDCFAQITARDLTERGERGSVDLERLLFSDERQARLERSSSKRTKAKLGTTRRKRLNDAGHVVANQAKTTWFWSSSP